MRIVLQRYEIRNWHPENDLRTIVEAARMCYQSDSSTSKLSDEDFIRRLISNGHLSPIEHSSLSVALITNRGVTHELVRHRIASYSQESTRYCNYSKEKFGNNVTFIWDDCIKEEDRDIWLDNLKDTEDKYLKLLELGYSPQIARGCLTNDLKTQIMITANYREWRHIFKLRCSSSAHPHIRNLFTPLYLKVRNTLPCIFEDLDGDIFQEGLPNET